MTKRILLTALAVVLVAVACQATWAALRPVAPKEAPPAVTLEPAEAVPAPKESPAPAPKAAPPGEVPKGSERPHAFEDLKAIYDSADLIVMFEVDAVQAKPDVVPRLSWEVGSTLLEVIKGKIEPGKILVHVESIVRSFDTPRSEMEKKQFVAALKPLADITQRRFQLVGAYAFPGDGKEAQIFRQLADADATRGSGGEGLSLQVKVAERVYPVDGPKVIEIILLNTGKESATYVQAPIIERDGKLYLTGDGRIRLLDATGHAVPDKGNVVIGQVPPGQSTPALILPQANFKEVVDMSRYFTLSAGRYTLSVMLAPPSGKGRVVSNGLTFQVGAVNLPEAAPKEPPVAPREVPATVEILPPIGPILKKEPPKLPDPGSYQPGQVVQGLAGLLRPSRSSYAVGDPIEVEFRLVNRGPRTMAVDARLERGFTLSVKPVGESPEPLFIRQVIPWPADTQGIPSQRAYLREGSFWGQVVNLNMLKSRDEVPPPTPEEIATGKDLSYERFGQTLFGFPKGGTYQVTATYKVPRPKPPADSPNAAPPTDWWFGELVTNPITIQVVEPTAPRMP